MSMTDKSYTTPTLAGYYAPSMGDVSYGHAVQIEKAANGFLVRKASTTFCFNTMKQLNKFIGETYQPTPVKTKRKYTKRKK